MAGIRQDQTRQVFALDILPVVSHAPGKSPADFVRDVAEIFVADVEHLLREQFSTVVIDDGVHSALISTLEQRLRGMLAAKREARTQDSEDCLTADNLKPSEVANGGKIQASIASLYRYVDQGRFYCLKRPGQANNRMLPAWQFVDPVPELLPDVLAALRGLSNTEVHAFFVTARDELNELAPAEVLAGKSFKDNGPLHASQLRLLKELTGTRLEQVLACIAADKRGELG